MTEPTAAPWRTPKGHRIADGSIVLRNNDSSRSKATELECELWQICEAQREKIKLLLSASHEYLTQVQERLNTQHAFRTEDSQENSRLYQIAMDGMKNAEHDLRAALAEAEQL